MLRLQRESVIGNLQVPLLLHSETQSCSQALSPEVVLFVIALADEKSPKDFNLR